MDVHISQVCSLPAGLDLLEKESVEQGFTMVARLRAEWDTGMKRFDGEGEMLVVAHLNEHLVGICGLSRDPYIEDVGVGRIRHLYVLERQRRSGVGRALVGQLLQHGNRHFRLIRLSTARASAFYESLGFTLVDEYKATHLMAMHLE